MNEEGRWRVHAYGFNASSLLFLHHAEVPESVRFVEASGGGCVDHEVVAKSSRPRC